MDRNTGNGQAAWNRWPQQRIFPKASGQGQGEEHHLQDMANPASAEQIDRIPNQQNVNTYQVPQQHPGHTYHQPGRNITQSANQQHRHGGSFAPAKSNPKRRGHAGSPNTLNATGGISNGSPYQGQSYTSPYSQGGRQTLSLGLADSNDTITQNQQAQNPFGSSASLTPLTPKQPRVTLTQRVSRASSSDINELNIQKLEKGVLCDSVGRDRYGRTRQKNKWNYFHPKMKFFNPILEPETVTRKAVAMWFKDAIQRESNIFHETNSFLDPGDARLTNLVIQAVDLVLHSSDNSTWRRTFVSNVSPLMVRVSNWTIDLLSDTTGWTMKDWILLVGKWFLSCLALAFLVLGSGIKSPAVRNGSCYDPIPYKDWNYCRYPRNEHETNPATRDTALLGENSFSTLEEHDHGPRKDPVGDESNKINQQDLCQHFNPESNRTLRPRLLCILHHPTEMESHGFEVVDVQQWIASNGLTSHPEYLFVAYTAKQFDCDDEGDRRALLALAEQATREAGLEAFWLGCACLDHADEDGIVEDVWRMSDLVRGANALVIVVGPPIEQRGGVVPLGDMLMGWGKRMWTLPEALLSPKGAAVSVYIRGTNDCPSFEKRSLAVQIWQDATVSRQLMDHFESSIILSPLELVVIALQCLNNRDTNVYDLDSRIKGEMAYVLMGLLRRRPKVNIKDSAFQAFARLSLANDSHLLLERLVCVMPRLPNQRWHDTADHWGAQLWDIYPGCQIAGIGSRDSIVLDGAFGASIRWDRFERVAYHSKAAIKRRISKAVLRLSPILLLVGLVLATKSPGGSLRAMGFILLILSLGVLAASPYLVRVLRTGKFWNTQALFFGFEGYMDIATIETHIFGTYMHRLSWSPFGSTLSRHAPGENDECVGLDPISDPKTRILVEDSIKTGNGGTKKRIFTLVDTFTMTVTMFEAENPPVAVLICGSEGGMQRAVLCSYQSAVHTFSRETVLRMETRVLGRLSRVARLRFCFQKSMIET